MQPVYWVVVYAIFALLASWMVLACAVTGMALREASQVVISTRWFALARRYGLARAVWCSLVTVIRKGAPGRRSRSVSRFVTAIPQGAQGWRQRIVSWLKPRFAALAAPLCGFLAAFFLPFVVFTFLKASSRSGKPGGWLLVTILIVGVMGALLAIAYWLLGLAYLASSSKRRVLWLRRLSFPDGLSQATRDQITMNIYGYSGIRLAYVFAALYPWLLIIVGYIVLSNSSSATSGSSQTTPSWLALIELLLLFSSSVFPAMAVARGIERRAVSAKICVELYLLLKPAEDGKQSDQKRSPGLIVDPLGGRRQDLVQIAVDLDDMAKQLDARQKHGFSPHPISTLLRAVSRAISEFLSNERSLQGIIPGDLTETLVITLALLGNDQDQSIYQRLQQKVSAFDEHGKPAVNVPERVPSGVARVMSFAASGIPKMALVVASIAAVAAIAIAVALVFLHRMNVSELLHYLSPPG